MTAATSISSPRYITRLVGHFFNSDELAIPRYDVIDTVTGDVMLASETIVFAHNEAEALNRAVPEAPTTPAEACEACEHGCDCAAGSPGCEHYSCWGGGPTGSPISNTCPSAKPLLAALYARHPRLRVSA